jgi:hypothetical protein
MMVYLTLLGVELHLVGDMTRWHHIIPMGVYTYTYRKSSSIRNVHILRYLRYLATYCKSQSLKCECELNGCCL